MWGDGAVVSDDLREVREAAESACGGHWTVLQARMRARSIDALVLSQPGSCSFAATRVPLLAKHRKSAKRLSHAPHLDLVNRNDRAELGRLLLGRWRFRRAFEPHSLVSRLVCVDLTGT